MSDLSVSFDSGIPLPIDLSPDELTTTLKRAKVACQTAQALGSFGVKIEPTEEDKEAARKVYTGEKKVSAALQNPAVGMHLAALLTEYDKQIVDSSAQLRTYITNRLIEESNSKDARTRMRALELLGKITDVGLFAERTEITIKHQSTEELEKRLYEKLEKVIEAEEVEVLESVSSESIDVVAELGSPDLSQGIEHKSFKEKRELIKPKPIEK